MTQDEASMTQHEPAAAIQASLKHMVSVGQSSMTHHRHEHAAATQHSTQASNANAVTACSKPQASCSLSGLSLQEAEPLLQLINRLQAAGSLAAPSLAVAHVAAGEELVPAQAGSAMVSEGGNAVYSIQAHTLHQQPQVCNADQCKGAQGMPVVCETPLCRIFPTSCSMGRNKHPMLIIHGLHLHLHLCTHSASVLAYGSTPKPSIMRRCNCQMVQTPLEAGGCCDKDVSACHPPLSRQAH